MNEENSGPESPVDEQTPPPEGGSDSGDAGEVRLDSEHSDTAKPKGRDAKNRIELKQTRERLERMQRREIERLAADKLSDPQDVWLAGVAVGDVCNADGDVDPELVDKTIGTLLEQHPHWAATQPAPQKARRGLTSGATTTTQRRAPSWADAIRSRQD